jgi:hypothetical protein
MKTYEQVCREQRFINEVKDVNCLLEWERNVLQEFDAKYDPDDDSENEEMIARKHMLKEQRAQQAETQRAQ